MIYQNVLELIGNTPLVKLNKIKEKYHLDCNIYAKLEKNNPASSIKDRAVYQMILDYQEKGLLKEGATIIEPTSGNTGIGLCCLCNYFNYKAIIIMPSSMSKARRDLMKAFNGELILVDGGMKECVEKANELNKQIEGSIILGQFDNSSNAKAHYLHTGKEIYDDLRDVDVVVAGIGSGGTITGLGQYFNENKKSVEIIGVEPKESPLITTGVAGKHKIQGIGANFVPSILKLEYVDKVITVEGDKAIEMSREIVKEEGLLVGISSGASLLGAIELAKDEKYKGKNIVVIFPDTGERYEWN